MIVLRFSSTNSIGAKLIKFGTWSWCSHVDIELPNGKCIGALPHGGVQIRSNDYDKDEADRIERYCIETSLVDEQKIYDFAKSQIGKPYDFSAILGFVVRENWESPNKWFCSEFVESTLRQVDCGLIRTTYDAWRITPKDLLISSKLHKMTD